MSCKCPQCQSTRIILSNFLLHTNAELLLGKRRRRFLNNNSALDQRLQFAVLAGPDIRPTSSLPGQTRIDLYGSAFPPEGASLASLTNRQ